MKIDKPKAFILSLDTPEGWFKNLLSRMDQVTTNHVTFKLNHVTFKLNNEFYMKYQKETGILWYSYSKIYLVLKAKFGLNYEQMNELIKGIMETNTNLGPVTTLANSKHIFLVVEANTNLVPVTPRIS